MIAIAILTATDHAPATLRLFVVVYCSALCTGWAKTTLFWNL